jgi:N-acetylneuraminate lyase
LTSTGENIVMSLHFHIKGIVPAVFTPMHPDGNLKLDLVQPMTDLLVSEDIGGLYVCGSTGEGPSLTREERMSVA